MLTDTESAGHKSVLFLGIHKSEVSTHQRHHVIGEGAGAEPFGPTAHTASHWGRRGQGRRGGGCSPVLALVKDCIAC